MSTRTPLNSSTLKFTFILVLSFSKSYKQYNGICFEILYFILFQIEGYK